LEIKSLTERGLEVETGQGSILVEEIQAPGKKRLPVKEFLKGSRLSLGNVLGK
jgi:methionyl-tRNA formyltransferase